MRINRLIIDSWFGLSELWPKVQITCALHLYNLKLLPHVWHTSANDERGGVHTHLPLVECQVSVAVANNKQITIVDVNYALLPVHRYSTNSGTDRSCLPAILVLPGPSNYSYAAVSCQQHQFTVITCYGSTLDPRRLSAEAERTTKQTT